MTPRAIGTIARTVVAIFAAAVFGALSFAMAANAQAPVKPSPKVTKPPVLTITITGPDVSPPIVIRSTEDPTLYAQVAGPGLVDEVGHRQRDAVDADAVGSGLHG